MENVSKIVLTESSIYLLRKDSTFYCKNVILKEEENRPNWTRKVRDMNMSTMSISTMSMNGKGCMT